MKSANQPDPSVFDVDAALAINTARMAHLGSLGLPLSQRRVVDIGAGPGHLAQFFVRNGCDVLCLDGRRVNIDDMHAKYPGLQGDVADAESDELLRFGRFEVVFCYGLLYHTAEPGSVLVRLAAMSEDLICLETCITDARSQRLEIVYDSAADNQGMQGLGCRPSPAYVIGFLRRTGFNVYLPATRPDHADFQFEYRDSGEHWRNQTLMRQIFVASRGELSNHLLQLTQDGSELFE